MRLGMFAVDPQDATVTVDILVGESQADAYVDGELVELPFTISDLTLFKVAVGSVYRVVVALNGTDVLERTFRILSTTPPPDPVIVVELEDIATGPATAALGEGGGAPSGPAGGDLAGNYPNPTVKPLPRALVDHTDASDTLAASDLDALLLVGDTSTLTIPAEADDDLGAGFTCDLLHLVAGDATVIPDAGVMLNGGTDSFTVDDDKAATLIKIGTDAWWLIGSVTVVP